MNSLTGTTYDFHKGWELLWDECLVHARDLGVACSLLLPRWSWMAQDQEGMAEEIRFCHDEDARVRREVLQDDLITNKYLRPGRLWDPWSNRVVPAWMAFTHDSVPPFEAKRYFAVSHAWLDEGGRQKIDTPINGHEWPVPIPSTTTLERIRTELLHHTSEDARHVWLDVLCLRQDGPKAKEDIRKEEWKLDIPTIGAVYYAVPTVVYYYSGLGLPFKIGDLKSQQHWPNRTWTVQELKDNDACVVAGISAESLDVFRLGGISNVPGEEATFAFCKEFRDLPRADLGGSLSSDILTALRVIFSRSATSDLDKIAGLNYIIRDNGLALPAYIVGADPGAAWMRFVKVLHPLERGLLLFYFPGEGSERAWCPSWHQAENISESAALRVKYGFEEVQFDNSRQEYWVEIPRATCRITGFAMSGRGTKRQGEVTMQSRQGDELHFLASVDHDRLIADGEYVLALERVPTRTKLVRCAMGPLKSEGKFTKETVIDVADMTEQWDQIAMVSERLVLD